MKIKTKRAQNHGEMLAKLRQEEAQLAANPSADSYLRLADSYRGIGMGKEADRMLQMAETLENGGNPQTAQSPHGLLCGAASPTMLVEVIQILSRTRLSGDFVVDAQAQTFHLIFNHGHIITALSDHHSPGLASFRMALRVPKGSYRFVQKPTDDIPHLIQEPTEMLLLNAMQMVDEQNNPFDS
jgi:hypothetical protein